jgi:hypothetical protein
MGEETAKAAKPAYKWSRTRRVRSQVMCAPAVRMVLVECWACRDEAAGGVETGLKLYPVLALRSTVDQFWAKNHRAEDYADDGGTAADLRKRGWQPRDEESNVEAIYLDPDYGLLAHDDPVALGDNTTRELVVCPWPQSEDESRLAAVIDLTRREAIRKATGQR